MYRAQIGEWVVKNLQSRTGALKLPNNQLDIFVVRDFLSQKECDELIRRIDATCQPSAVLGPIADPDYRTSHSGNLDPNDPFVHTIEQKINSLLGIQAEHGETIQGQRYHPGQQFKPHYDFFHKDQPYWDQMERDGGQRTWTAMAFLNVPEGGGQTAFPNANLRITPRTGNLLVWNNMTRSGQPNSLSLHQGVKVEAGVKYVITKWYRERPWTPHR